MWPFTKKPPIPEALPIDGPWTVSQGRHNGQVLIVRSNSGYREFAPVESYSHQVGIAVPLRAPEPSGLPSAMEGAELEKIEDLLCGSLEPDAASLLVAVLTTCGMREFVFYTRDRDEVARRFEALRQGISSHEIQLMIQSDKKWSTYHQYS